MQTLLFLCTGNACRSQMAEGFTRHLAGKDLRVFSAGTRPAGLDPRAVVVMAEIGLDISGQASKGIDQVPYEEVDTIITLCDGAAKECPTPPASVRRHHWPLQDPAAAKGVEKDVLAVYRRVRDDIQRHVEAYLTAVVRRA